jgi:hypothetical protein
MESKPEHKHRPRTDHKHYLRDDHKGKNKSEQRPRKILEVILCARSSPRVRFSVTIFLCASAPIVVWLLAFRCIFGNGIGD